MRSLLERLNSELGIIGYLSLIVLVATLVFFSMAVQPLVERRDQLDQQLRATTRAQTGGGLKVVEGQAQAMKVAAFYTYFDRTQRIDDWLATLYGIAKASGLELQVGEYQLTESAHRIERYRIRLPVAGNYAQIRGFLEVALAEVPVLSLDQATFRRRTLNSSVIDSEIVLTLHLLRK